MIFKGSGVALVTPFNSNGNVNFEKLDELITYHIANNTDALIICGTTGEGSTLSLKEKEEIFQYVYNKANKKIKLIAGTGSNNTKDAILLSKYAATLGYDGILVVTPYYNKCSNEGAFLHYKAISDAIKDYDTKIILYNVPSRTGFDLNIDTIVRLAKLENIVAIKEAKPDLSKISKIINLTKDLDFDLYSGNDDLILPILSVGGIGVISVMANIIPEKIHNLCYSYFSNNQVIALRLHNEMQDLTEAIFSDVNPIGIKYAMNKLGFNVGSTRLPLSLPNTTTTNLIDNLLEKNKYM